MAVSDALALLPNKHRRKPKFRAMITETLNPIDGQKTVAQQMHDLYDIDTAVGDQLVSIGDWVGAPKAVPDVTVINGLFGFDGQESGLSWTETDDPSVIAGFWRESGSSGYFGVDLTEEQYRIVIRAKIYRNSCKCTIPDAYHILDMITDVPYVIFDSGQMWIGLCVGHPDRFDLQFMRMMYPKPAGVQLRIFEGWFDGFGWDGQPESLGFGETDDGDAGGYWVEELI